MKGYTAQDFLLLFEGNLTITEWFREAEINIQATTFRSLSEQVFLENLTFLSSRDKLQLTIQVDHHDPIEYYSQSHDNTFFSTLADQTDRFEKISCTVKIIKTQVQGRLSLYFYQDFVDYLEQLEVEAQLHQFNAVSKDYLIFEFQTYAKEFKSQSIWFVNRQDTGTPAAIDRQEILDKGISCCSYNHFTDFKLIPEDFLFSAPAENALDKLFSKLRCVCAMSFLIDISELKKNKFSYRLNGYKSIQSEIEIDKQLSDPLDQYFKVYTWVYNAGNLNDKLGLARNIISLHMDDPTSMTLKGDAFQSIQSSYKVYEKQNIKQYIEIRNKVTDQLLSFHDRANKIIETFAAGFQKSALALITFYMSVFLLKFLNKDDYVGIFTWEASILSTIFISCSILYFFVSRWEVNAQRKRFVDNYEDLKARYEDLLDKQDIARILNGDREFNTDLRFMDEKKAKYSWMWIGFLVIFFLSTWLLYFFAKANAVLSAFLILQFVFR
ncbi:hypothetical protein GM921_09670 [Pedobacter sp. LMG 31464]|uniref:Uncharacterized protein n=1 Tax=Pedobacter planticolens TaxID=2679964 RepID=A0A923IW23_9SPHI|nr:hypothetical protein [Pedobacter planticolens]MBB2145754.1 hypothetical protein [Pedobacter planticolens]